MRCKIVALVPAHNEEDQLELTIRSLLDQTRPPDLVVVASDNSTDATADIGRLFEFSYPGRVVAFETENNPHRKAGAMNQAYERYAMDADFVMTMDADTVFEPEFIEKCLESMIKHPEVGGASACPMLKDQPADVTAWQSYLWRSSKLDFGGYMRMLVRWKMKPDVLSGYGTIFRAEALQQVAAERGSQEPWDTSSIVEDYKISLDLRRLGWGLRIIPNAFAYTDAPLTLRELWRQRARWAGGTWQELSRAGWKPWTRRTWIGAFSSLFSTFIRMTAVFAWTMVAVFGLGLFLHPIWLVPIIVAVWDRLDLVRYTNSSDWKDRVLAGTILPMDFIGIVREAWMIHSLGSVARRKSLKW